MNELDDALASALEPSGPDRERVAAALKTWAIARSNLSVGTPHVKGMLRGIDALAEKFILSFDERGSLRVVVTASGTASILLERGASWLKGGDWQSVVLATVSK